MQAFPVARLRQPFVPIHGFMGQASQSIQPSVPRFIGQEGQPAMDPTEAEQQRLVAQHDQLLRLAAAKMIKSAEEMANSLDTTYNNYVNFSTSALYRLSISNAVLGFIGPFIAAWSDASDAKKATAIIQANNSLEQKWVNVIRDNFLIPYIDDIRDMDPDLADQANKSFERVNIRYQRNVDLIKEIKEFPTVLVGDFEKIFFPTLYKTIVNLPHEFAEIAVGIYDIYKAAKSLVKGGAKVLDKIAKIAEKAGEAAETAPWFVLGGIAIIGVWLLLK